MTRFLRLVALCVDIFFCTYLIVCASIFLFNPLKFWFFISGQKMNEDMLITALLIVCVYCFLLGKTTFGKLLCYLKIVNAKTLEPANFFQIIIRNCIIILTLGLSYLGLLFSNGKYTTLHDKISGTTVIREK